VLKQTLGASSVSGNREVETVVTWWLVTEEKEILQVEMENVSPPF
jgi:hypothetical protein